MKDKNFLTSLYFKKFELTEREKRLMNNNTFEDSEAGKLANVRNDQSISEVRKFQQTLDEIIDKYLEDFR